MAAQKSAQQANALLSLYLKEFKNTYGKDITINRYKEKWAATDVIESVGYERARELMVYYFSTGKTGHPLQWFFYNFDQLDKMLNELVADEAKRKKIREATARRVEEWRARNELRVKTD